MDKVNDTEEQQLTATQRAKKKYYLKNREKFQQIKTEWNKNAYHNKPEYKEMVKKCSNNYYHSHKDEIRAKAKAKQILSQ